MGWLLDNSLFGVASASFGECMAVFPLHIQVLKLPIAAHPFGRLTLRDDSDKPRPKNINSFPVTVSLWGLVKFQCCSKIQVHTKSNMSVFSNVKRIQIVLKVA